jgi:hypothetical protein
MRRVPHWKVHAFTAVQLVCLIVLWLVKEHPQFGILFPLFIALLVPLRFALSRFFLPQQLQALDADELPAQEESQWV